MAASGSTKGNSGKDRVVPFRPAFKETLALHIDAQRRAGTAFVFESSWKKPYSHRGVASSSTAARHPPALEIYSRLTDAQKRYDDATGDFPV